MKTRSRQNVEESLEKRLENKRKQVSSSFFSPLKDLYLIESLKLHLVPEAVEENLRIARN